MGVTCDHDAAFDLADAADELVVELTLLKQFLRLTRERALERSQLFGESGDDGLRGADDSRFEFFDPVGESVNELDDGI